MNKRILIIGGVAGGASVAARARRLDAGAEIIMFERGPHVSFSNCSLPYYPVSYTHLRQGDDTGDGKTAECCTVTEENTRYSGIDGAKGFCPVSYTHLLCGAADVSALFPPFSH